MALRFGMVGGGNGGNIGNSHRIGAQMDAMAVLCAGCLTRNAQQNKIDCKNWGITDPDRMYDNYREMAEKESKRADCIDFVAIVTPNKTHYEMAKCFLEHGINVVCEKPFTMDIRQAQELKEIAKEHDCEMCITYTYAHYPILRHCRHLIESGEIGEIIDMMMEYPEQWMIESLSGEGGMEFAKWASDPKIAGNSNVTATMGVHLYYLITSMTGQPIKRVASDFGFYPKDAKLETVNRFFFELGNGAKGLGWTSNVAIGHDCSISLKIFGEKGAIEWTHNDPTRLRVTMLNGTVQYYNANKDYLYGESLKASRLPAGHPEGFYEAYGNIYHAFCQKLIDKRNGELQEESAYFYPHVEDGIGGVRFVNACVSSYKQRSAWVDLDTVTDEEAVVE